MGTENNLIGVTVVFVDTGWSALDIGFVKLAKVVQYAHALRD